MARPWAPRPLRRAALVLAVIYLAAVWLDALRVGWLERLLPDVSHPFVQVAELFPEAAPFVIEWRVRGWSCTTRKFEEVDVRPLFPIRQDDKENRFSRAMFFYHRELRVLEALDAYITGEHNRREPERRIGGVMLISLRVPIPAPGTAPARYQHRPLDDYPPSVERRYWYTTSPRDRSARCAAAP
jgi:hypothetical protein